MTSTSREYSLWHPVCQMKELGVPPKVIRGEGIYLELEDGRRLIDAISSWWCNLHGHCAPHIVRAIQEQVQNLEHVLFAGFTHEPALQISEKLQTILPSGLKRFFFSDSGSTAVEIALKLALQYWRNKGHDQRQSFICFDGGYHGDTFGAMSVAGTDVFNAAFKDLLFPSFKVPYPECAQGEGVEDAVLQQIEIEITKNPERYAGIIVEPLVQGASGMRMASPRFFKELRALSERLNVLLIFDEVFTGFGRTGDWFASTKIGICPDLICLSKGITGGFLAMGCTVATDKIYDAFYSEDRSKGFYHSHSYMANPIACAAAVASYELLQQNEAAFRGMEDLHWKELSELSSHKRVKGARTCGTIAAFQLQVEDSSYLGSAAKDFAREALNRGILLRPIGDTVYLVPPYCTTAEQLGTIYSAIRDCL